MIVVHQDGTFRIEDMGKVVRVPRWMAAHQCIHRTMHWAPFAFSPEAVSRPCLDCGDIAPDGFQALYWFIAGDQLWPTK